MARSNPDFRDPLARSSKPDRTTIDDDLTRVGPLFARPLFEPTTSQLAHEAAEQHFTRRESEIFDLVDRHGPKSLWQLAVRLSVADHTMSGRITSPESRSAIESTGERSTKPATGCKCDVYRRCPARPQP